MSLVLITNDDGIFSPGLVVVEQAFAGLGEIWVVAPDAERSACGRSVTLHKPLRVKEHGARRLAVGARGRRPAAPGRDAQAAGGGERPYQL